jgi:hypothetical protein
MKSKNRISISNTEKECKIQPYAKRMHNKGTAYNAGEIKKQARESPVGVSTFF